MTQSIRESEARSGVQCQAGPVGMKIIYFRNEGGGLHTAVQAGMQ